MSLLVAAASLALAAPGVNDKKAHWLWSCAMAAGERAQIRQSKDKFLFAFYFPEGSRFRSEELVIADGADRLPNLAPIELVVGQWGDVHWLAKNQNAIAYRFDSLRIYRQGDFATSRALIEFFPRTRSDVILAGNCAILLTSDPKAALDDIRRARLAK